MTRNDARLVLIAEDDADIGKLVSRTLVRAGFDVALAGNGTEALALAEQRPPAAAVLDVSLPGFDGLELTRRLRQTPSTEKIPIILVTARARPEDADRGFDAGASAYMSKPFSPAELRDRIEGLLAQ